MKIFNKHKPINSSFSITTESQIGKMSFLDLAVVLKDFRNTELKSTMKEAVKTLLEKGKI